MKRCFLFLVFTLSLTLSFSYAAEGKKSTISWFTNYDEALSQARASHKPILLLFTGSDWCSWCIKLENEVLSTPDFAAVVGDRFVFFKADFPLNKTISPQLTANNKALQKRFNVHGYPSIVLIEPENERQIGTAGYEAGGGQKYGLYLLRMVESNASHNQKMSLLDEQSGAELKRLYEHATKLGRADDAAHILATGLQSSQRNFFLLEQYRRLAEAGDIHGTQAALIKEELLSQDSHDLKENAYQLALIAFETSYYESAEISPDCAVASLIEYIQGFGAQDREQQWRLKMLISQVYFEHDKLSEAIYYANSSYETAPSEMQADILLAIKNMQASLSPRAASL